MTFYEFQVVYSSDGKVLFCQWTGNEDETRPLSVWLGNYNIIRPIIEEIFKDHDLVLFYN